MRIIKLILIVCSFFLTVNYELSYAQTGYWDKVQFVTSGNIDRNPTYDTKRPMHFGTTQFSFLVFEKWSTSNSAKNSILNSENYILTKRIILIK